MLLSVWIYFEFSSAGLNVSPNYARPSSSSLYVGRRQVQAFTCKSHSRQQSTHSLPLSSLTPGFKRMFFKCFGFSRPILIILIRMFPDIKCTSPPDFRCQWWKSLQTVFCHILWATFVPDGLALHPELIGHPQKISDDPKITRLVEHDSLMYVIVHSHRVFSRRLCTLPPEPLCMLSSHVHHCIVLYPLPFDCRGAGCGILTLTSDQAVFDIWSQGSMCIRDVTYPRKIVMLCFGRSIWSEGVKSKIVEQSWLFVPAPHCWSVHCDKERNKPETKFYN